MGEPAPSSGDEPVCAQLCGCGRQASPRSVTPFLTSSVWLSRKGALPGAVCLAGQGRVPWGQRPHPPLLVLSCPGPQISLEHRALS